tara:strand:- start:559 stop:1254 length:696 start_codon:yes stop_codon:yes gene_type:complete
MQGLLTLLLLSLSLSSTDALRPAATSKPRHAHVAMATPLATQWSRYLKALEENPMPTKMITAAVLSGTGDVIAQGIEGVSSFALRRFLTLVAVNVLYIVPILTGFYAVNEWLVTKLEMKDGWKKTGVQLAFDQLINAPIVIAGFFTTFQVATAIAEALCTGFATMPTLSGLASSVATQLRSTYVPTVISNWKIWVLPQLVNFALVPPYARVAFANAIALVWNVVLSVAANK